MAELSHAQLDVAAAFFALRESEGFVLVGGAALITLELVDRQPTNLEVSRPHTTPGMRQ